MIGRYLDRTTHVVAQFLLVVDNLHRATAKHVGGAHHDRIADACGTCYGILEIGHADPFGAGDARLRQHLVEALTIFGAVDVIDGGTVDTESGALEFCREIDRCLTAELDNDAVRLFLVHNVQYILHSQRLEIEAVGDIKVRADGLRVVVDDDRFDAHLTQCPDRVHGAVVELDALPDADRSGAEYNHLFPIGNSNLVLGSAERGVIVWRYCLKFCGTGIDHLVARQDVVRAAHRTNLIARLLRKLGDGYIRKSNPLCRRKQFRRER